MLPPVPVPAPSLVRSFAFTVVAASVGCAATPQPTKTPPTADAPGLPAAAPRVVRVDPMSGNGAVKPPGLAALEEELRRGIRELGAKGKPPPYYIAYEIH